MHFAPAWRHAPAVGLALFAAVTCFEGTATADVAAASPVAQAPAPPRHRMVWSYPRFRPVEYVGLPLVFAAGLYIERGTHGYPTNGLRGGILLDDFSRDILVADSAGARYDAAIASNYIWHVTQYFPVVDSLVTPLLTDDFNVDVAVQMTLINAQVQGVAFLVTRSLHRTVGRVRPIVSGCDEDPEYDDSCGVDNDNLHVSFFSGHASMAFAGAASTCSHHIAFPMYGGNAFDAGICALSLTAATTVAVLRIVADKHWWSDVVAGASLGLGVGFGMPFLLHYGSPLAATDANKGVAVLPLVGPDLTGLSVVGYQ